MTRSELLEQIFLLRLSILILVIICIILVLKLSTAIRDSNLWQDQFFALKNTFLKLTKNNNQIT